MCAESDASEVGLPHPTACGLWQLEGVTVALTALVVFRRG
jgi:hypothetical protein